MSMHVPALHAPPMSDDASMDVAAAQAERRRDVIETLITVFAVVLVIALISVVGVALELG